MKKVKIKKDFGFKGTALKEGDVVEVPKESADIFASHGLAVAADKDAKVTVKGKDEPVQDKVMKIKILKQFTCKGHQHLPGEKVEVGERVALSWIGDGLAEKVKEAKPPKDKMIKDSKNK